MKESYISIGLMSGTSLDGIDASLIETNGQNYCKTLHNFHLPYKIEFQKELRRVLQTHNNWFGVEHDLTIYHAQCVAKLLEAANFKTEDVDIIGFHGQTIYHNPQELISWQIGNPHLLAKLTKIDVVSDFRRRDIAFGGQGAPLVPIFHKCIMQDELSLPVVVINIGGVANITYIANDIRACDTGPGNALINDAMIKYYNKEYDDEGYVASVGQVDYKIIDSILADKFFQKRAPKSLDRNHFEQYLQLLSPLKPEDIIATLTKFTVSSIVKSIRMLPNLPKKIYLCGGGTKNVTLVKWLSQELPQIQLISSKGLDPDFIESQAFAYLAVRLLKNLPSSFPTTTSINQEKPSGVFFPSYQ